MRRWISVGLATTATLAGTIGFTPAAHAGTGDIPGADTTATNPFEVLPPELLACIAAQTDPSDQVAVNQVCKQWSAAAHKFPMSVQDLTVVRTQTHLEAALASAQARHIVVIPTWELAIRKAPVNPASRITLYAARASQHRPTVVVSRDVHVAASGYIAVRLHGSAKVTASGNVEVFAFDQVEVIASGNVSLMALRSATVTASGDVKMIIGGQTKVTASGNVRVGVSESSTQVVVRDSSVSLWVTEETRGAVRPDPGVNPIITVTGENELWSIVMQ